MRHRHHSCELRWWEIAAFMIVLSAMFSLVGWIMVLNI